MSLMGILVQLDFLLGPQLLVISKFSLITISKVNHKYLKFYFKGNFKIKYHKIIKYVTNNLRDLLSP